MPEAENQALAGATNDSWRTWLMTGARRSPVDRRRMRGSFRGLKKMLIEGMANGDERPHAWKDFSGAMIRHAVDEAMGSLPAMEKQVVKLAYFGGYSNRQIANEVGLTEATVQRRLRRALESISEYIQHGRAVGRRAVYALFLWATARSLSDSTHHVAQAAALMAAAAIIVSQPAPSIRSAAPGASGQATQQVQSQPAPAALVSPLPSPTAAPLTIQAQVPPVQVPAVQVSLALPVSVPPVPTPPVKVNVPAP